MRTPINDNRELIDMDRRHVWHHITRHDPSADPFLLIEGKGMRVWDAAGREYLDAVAGGVWTVNIGYGRESVSAAVSAQLSRMNFFAAAAGTEPGARFAAALLAKMPAMSRVYFSPSGSEANEKAYKMVRQIAHTRHAGGKYKILYRARDYHGTTIAALASGGQDQRNARYGPMPDGFVQLPHCLEYRSPFPPDADYAKCCADAIEEVILREGAETIGSMVLEPITAGGGVIVPPDGYWPRVKELCVKHDILLHMDEVVCGFGRSGEWFEHQAHDLRPDFVTMAKGLASGYAAFACTAVTEDIFNLFHADPSDPLGFFRDISTYGGCAAGPAAALEVMRIIEEENLLENSRRVGAYLLNGFRAMQNRRAVIGHVRGKALFIGVELVADRESKEPADETRVQAVVAGCKKRGLLIGATNRSIAGFNNTLLFAPPLICTEKDADQILEITEAALAEEFGSDAKPQAA